MSFERKITVEHSLAGAAELHDFPLLLEIREERLKIEDTDSRDSGSRNASARGAAGALSGRLEVTVEPGGASLPFEVAGYDPAECILRLWVRVPLLSSRADAKIRLVVAEKELADRERRGGSGSAHGVWDESYRLVVHTAEPGAGRSPRDSSRFTQNVSGYDEPETDSGEGTGRRQHREPETGGDRSASAALRVRSSDSLVLDKGLTIEALVTSESDRSEGFQAIVGKWHSPSTFQELRAFEAGNIRGRNTRGFFGACFDGRYVYFVPQHDGESRHGKVLRYDTTAPFDAEQSWQVYDADGTSGLRTRGYYGGVFDGRYVYFVPRFDGRDHHSRLLRYDTEREFEDPAAWRAHDAGVSVSYQSAAFDGRYIYFSPGYENLESGGDQELSQATDSAKGLSGRVLRYDTRGDFDSPGSYAVYDADGTSGLAARCFDGAVYDGIHVYFVPLEGTGVLLRYDTRGDFSDRRSWEAFDYNAHFEPQMGWSVGAVFDGRYIYYTPYSGEVAVRYDTRAGFCDPTAWQGFAPGRDSAATLRGYDGAVFDGRYVYFIPFKDKGEESTDWHSDILRFDSLGDFLSEASWQRCDARRLTTPKTGGFNGAAFDGRFIYCAPWREGTREDGSPIAHGKVLRCDTTGTEASFILHYTGCGHNGGLCAALPGPTVLLNTEKGVFHLAASRPLTKGRHYLAASYDGCALKLYVDGELWAEKPASGRVQANETDLTVGRVLDGRGFFRGRIDEVRVSSVARSAEWLRATCRNLTAPSECCRAEDG